MRQRPRTIGSHRQQDAYWPARSGAAPGEPIRCATNGDQHERVENKLLDVLEL